MEKTVEVTIYGRPNCPFCVRAKQFAEGVAKNNPKFIYEYVDIWDMNISMEQLSEQAGKTVKTVPQIFANDEHVGGSDKFEQWLVMEDLL